MRNDVYKVNTSVTPQTETRITGIVSGSFHYRSQLGSSGAYRFGGVYGSYIEFDVFAQSAVTISKGDTLKYYQYLDLNSNLEDITPGVNSLVNEFYVVDINDGFSVVHIVAYDTTVKLSADYSMRLKELDSNWPLGFTVEDLLLDAASVCGVTYTPRQIPEGWEQSTLIHFYVDGITCRDIFAYAAEIAGGFAVCLSAGTITMIRQGDIPTRYWEHGYRYLVSPDDEDHSVIVNGQTYLNKDVWYKMDSLTKKSAPANYDGVRILYPDGAVKGHYDAVVSPTNYYYITNNVLMDNLTPGFSTWAAYAQFLYSKLNFAYLTVSGVPLAGSYDYTPTRVSLFPFKAPYQVGEIAYVMDPNGVITAFPVMSLDLTDSECVLEGYGHVDSDSDYNGNTLDSTIDNTLQALTAQANRIDSTINKAIIVKAYSKSVTISGSSSLAVTQTDLGISNISGYTIAGVVAYNTSNDNVYPRSLSMNATTATLVNKSSSSVTTTFWVYMMHVKSEMLEVQ